MIGNSQSFTSEKLFLNAVAFSYPTEPVTFYFSNHDVPTTSLQPIRGDKLLTQQILALYPEAANGKTIYTSFCRQIEGFVPLQIDFNDPENYYLVKQYYNREILHYFRHKERIVEKTFVGDTQVWIRNRDLPGRRIKGCAYYDRYTLKISYDTIHQTPLLVVTYDNPAKIWAQTVQSLQDKYNDIFDNPFGSAGSNPMSMLNKVLVYENKKNKHSRFTIARYSDIKNGKLNSNNIDLKNVFPIVNNRLAEYLGTEGDDNTSKVNRYKKQLPKLNGFIGQFLMNEDFRSIIPIEEYFYPVEANQVHKQSKSLAFAGGKTGFVPRSGLNDGPYDKPSSSDIRLLFIAHESQIPTAEALANHLRKGYGLFKGLPTYLGVNYSYEQGIKFSSSSPYKEIESKFLARIPSLDTERTSYCAIYLTPIGKNSCSSEEFRTYYQIKELLLQHGVALQCIESDRVIKALEEDQAYNKSSLAFILQNLSIAINAKLGGTPWRIDVPEKKELVIGVGAFVNRYSGVKYIGSAFSFDNTGSFNAFEYFLQNELDELAGCITSSIRRFKRDAGNPQRLIIHYFKDMRDDEVEKIEAALRSLDVNIPIYIVTINKTESEDIFVFDDAYDGKMPISGRYISLDRHRYLLCNNTRYENYNKAPDSYPFPVKLKIWSPNAEDSLSEEVIRDLVDQVFQFSRIYWKSVAQQNLPVTIKYPEMVAEIAPYFKDQSCICNQISNTLWFL